MQEKVMEILNYVLDKNGKETLQEMNYKLSLRDDLHLDSLDLAELTVRLEDEFDVDIFEYGIINTIGEIVDIIRRE
ncbi:acyl carrier protein [Tissierella praeacuta DSM 18095]|uniref:Acyl carrier protein n=1 Tax=Tissierella praeacuta DSM 18095 TaxID=1123404 RepID=A0A1M4X2H0_9FIRM|nr:phosphopantetheine-binding protein [Tissierella praeacuta]SHE87646.1 acyl carrier protein [Tissierella praeacuta DSM 18095]SUO99653.1 acyl carrier protein [Tissierella praeacuta]